MSYISAAVSVNDKENEFIKAFVAAITNNTGITVVVPDNYDDFDNYVDDTIGSTGSAFEFDLSIGACTITFRRNGTANTNSYLVFVGNTRGSMNMCQISGTVSNVTLRTFKFCIVRNSLITAILLGGYDNASITSYPVSVIVIGSPVNGCAMGTTTAKRAASSSIILSNNTNAKFVHRLPYMYNTSDTTNIEIVKSKVLVAENTENKLLVLNNVYDVSTVPADNKIIIDNKKYFCLDNHTIMEV